MSDHEDKQGEIMLQDQTAPDWMRGMFEHFSVTGTYRAEDVQRVLGDPRQGFQIQIAPNMEVAYRADTIEKR